MSAGESTRVWLLPPEDSGLEKAIQKLELETGRGKLAVHPTRPLVVVGGSGNGGLTVWNCFATPNGTMKWYENWSYKSLALSADGRVLVTASPNLFRIELRDPVSLDIIRRGTRVPGQTQQVFLSPDGSRACSLHTAYANDEPATAGLRSWDTATMTELWNIPPTGKRWVTSAVHHTARLVALAGPEPGVSLYDTDGPSLFVGSTPPSGASGYLHSRRMGSGSRPVTGRPTNRARHRCWHGNWRPGGR